MARVATKVGKKWSDCVFKSNNGNGVHDHAKKFFELLRNFRLVKPHKNLQVPNDMNVSLEYKNNMFVFAFSMDGLNPMYTPTHEISISEDGIIVSYGENKCIMHLLHVNGKDLNGKDHKYYILIPGEYNGFWSGADEAMDDKSALFSLPFFPGHIRKS